MKNGKRIESYLFVAVGLVLMMIPLLYSFFGKSCTEKLMKEITEKVGREEIEKDDDVLVEDGEEALLADGIIGMIEIEKLNLMYPIVEGTGNDELRFAVGHMEDTAGIGKRGNCVLAGHRGSRYGEFFKYLNLLEVKDEVQLTDQVGGSYLYEVVEIYVTESYDTSVKRQSDTTELTLITCENKGTMRLIVKCVKKSLIKKNKRLS